MNTELYFKSYFRFYEIIPTNFRSIDQTEHLSSTRCDGKLSVPQTQFNFEVDTDRVIAGNLDDFTIPETQVGR